MEPWNYRDSDDRTADSLPLFIIFCEDEVSEPVYFKYFETALIKVNLIGNQKSKTDHVIKALAHCYQEDYMERKGGIDYLKQQETQVWCVFDRDDTKIEGKQAVENVSFNESITTAEGRGLKVAWSNDAFELWILLHFEELKAELNYADRETYYQRLTDIFEQMPDKNEDLVKVLAIKNSNYKQHFKREKNFRNAVRPYLVSKTLLAIERAKALEKTHDVAPAKNYSDRIPCTMVHYLVEELLRLGKKQV
ncbi:RloB family protein [Dyadobacter sp. LJ53]|uniref:RloB family protein n=1 Tax=Dyadobacter chenwenxiniae TaxID=2906456 RepID=UPI001F3ED401|nr:RloB family protein [Dyadobacter chenwenxiniae]MCF0049230.1 RloB family protein [Dyadobacter chenwenxiniae]